MHVAVVIIGFRNASDVVDCVDALQRSVHQDFEIIICENGGRAAFEALADKLSASLAKGQKLQVLCAPKNLGFAGGVNVGLKATPGADAWWVLNPDTLAAPDAMAKLVARFQEGDCEAVGSTVLLDNGKVQSYGGIWQAWLGRAVSIGLGSQLVHPDRSLIERKQNYLNGASLFLGRHFLKTVGYMREDYFLYCEEVEWCLRARKRGMRLGFAPDAHVVHRQGTTMNNFDRLPVRGSLPVYLGERNRILLTKDLYPVLFAVVALLGIPFLLYRWGGRGAWRQCAYGLSGYFAGLLGKRGPPPWLPV